MELATIENLEHKNKLTKTQNPNQCVVDYIQNDNKSITINFCFFVFKLFPLKKYI